MRRVQDADMTELGLDRHRVAEWRELEEQADKLCTEEWELVEANAGPGTQATALAHLPAALSAAR